MKLNQLRKFAIGVGAFGVVICLFWIYTRITDTVPIIAPEQSGRNDLQMPGSTEDVQRIGDTKIIGSERTRYTVLDPETKETRQVFGFEKLLNPGRETSRRKVTKPYIEFYEPSYQCRIDSDAGTFQMEPTGGNPSPREAQLDGNVVIHLTPKAGSKVSETSIYLDDLTFSSERSEFTTEGPVKIISEKMTLNGRGLNLIFDTENGRVEYMRISDLKALHVRDGLASGGYTGSSETPKTGPTEPVSSQKGNAVAASDYYQCTLQENVRIEYGSELIVSGAQRVNIQNILFSDKHAESASNTPPQSETAQKSTSPDTAGATRGDGSKDVFVCCDGGIVLQPMQPQGQNKADAAPTELSVEMSGTPLRIDRVTSQNQDKTEPLVYCGLLEYKPQQDVLRLFTDAAQPQIVLAAQRSRSRIQTRGNVLWDRKNRYANIAGPGTIYLSGSDPTLDPSEIMFNGMMDLLFAEPPDKVLEPVIRSINFSGGINGILKENGGYLTKADSARLDFGLKNALSTVRLLGDVLLESMESGKFRKAAADSATFHFEENKVKTADLTGGASVRSDQGNLNSDKIEIAFESDPNGESQPARVKTTGDTVLETTGGPSVKTPAKFEAKWIDYDLLSGCGVAHGPIRFTFYQSPDKAGDAGEPAVPIVITADENGEFTADGSRSIRQIVFNRNVLVTRQNKLSGIEQVDTLHGDKLTVYLNTQNDVNKIVMTEGKVNAESKRLQDGHQIFHSKIYCNSMTYDRTSNEILIDGPGKMHIMNTPLDSSAESSSQPGLRNTFAAIFEGFGSIRWQLDKHKIIAQEDRNQMTISYFPLIGEAVQRQNFLYTRQLEADYTDEPFTLTHIYTDQGVDYEQYNEDRTQQLHHVTGQTLTYDAESGQRWLIIRGSEENPCYADGWRAEQAYIDLDTGQVKTTLSETPGVIRGF